MKKIIVLGLLTLTATLTFAQSWKAASSDDAILPGVDASKVTGNVITAGSSTVFPLAQVIAKKFKDEGYKGNITIDSIGTGAGMDRFGKSGETDIANASRPIKDSEAANARKIGREPLGFQVATDAMAVIVNSKNDWCKDITKDELAKLFSTAVNWNDVRADWPSEKIQRYAPATSHGTFDYFVEEIFNKNTAPLLSASGLLLNQDLNLLVGGVSKSKFAIGFVGFAYYKENEAKLKAVAINGVIPSQETVDNGKYNILARPLLLYTTADIIKAKPQVAAYIAYFLTNVNSVVKKVGYFPAAKAILDKSKSDLLALLK